MGSQGAVGDRLRNRLRAEREHAGWSQLETAARLSDRRNPGACTIHQSTVAKIETGDRAVRPEELYAYAELFRLSTDTLLGRGRAGDLAYAANSLASNAQRMAGEIGALCDRLRGNLDDVRDATTGQSDITLVSIGGTALIRLGEAKEWLNRLARQFPIPTD